MMILRRSTSTLRDLVEEGNRIAWWQDIWGGCGCLLKYYIHAFDDACGAFPVM